MKVIVISDSHTKNDFERFFAIDNFDFAIHAGDAQTYDEEELSKDFNKYVRGNTDFLKLPRDEKFKLENLKVGLTHGHLYYVGSDYYGILNEFDDCDVIIHGHTHVVNHEIITGKLILNPGSTSQSRSRYPKTFMVLDINNRTVKVSVISCESLDVIEQGEYVL